MEVERVILSNHCYHVFSNAVHPPMLCCRFCHCVSRIITLYLTVLSISMLCCRFCQGCVIPCDSDVVGELGGQFIAVDWDTTTLHLKYLLAQEKVRVQLVLVSKHRSVHWCV